MPCLFFSQPALSPPIRPAPSTQSTHFRAIIPLSRLFLLQTQTPLFLPQEPSLRKSTWLSPSGVFGDSLTPFDVHRLLTYNVLCLVWRWIPFASMTRPEYCCLFIRANGLCPIFFTRSKSMDTRSSLLYWPGPPTVLLLAQHITLQRRVMFQINNYLSFFLLIGLLNPPKRPLFLVSACCPP